MPTENERFNEQDFAAPYHAAEGLRRLCTTGPYLVKDRTGEHLADFHTLEGALEFLDESAALGFSGDAVERRHG